jgi:hypothetical protein
MRLDRLFNEGWEDLGIQDPFKSEPANKRKPDTTEEDLKIVETAKLHANLDDKTWETLSLEEKTAYFKKAQAWHLEHGFD